MLTLNQAQAIAAAAAAEAESLGMPVAVAVVDHSGGVGVCGAQPEVNERVARAGLSALA